MSDIHSTAIIDPAASIGAGVSIGPFCVVGPDVTLQDNVELKSHVVIEGITELGKGVQVHSFATLGGPPQHAGYKGEPTRLVVGEETVIRENVTLNRGTESGGSETRVGANCFIMAYSHVAHDCVVGDRVIMANAATLAGHCHVGDGVIIGGLAAIQQKCRIGTGAFVGGLSGVSKDVIPYGAVVGERAELGGLNIVGLKRGGHDRQAIHGLRNAYRTIFSGSGTLQERAHEAKETHAGNLLVEAVVDFLISGSGRAFCTPRDTGRD